ncbi:MAG TPA: hypothetical protein PLY34_05280 [Ferruginibacter sp.]|nr:hypothetical protein [Ferruginibacter sp.]HPH91012.1 hypothetical protein [Ferruginibacter sp.]
MAHTKTPAGMALMALAFAAIQSCSYSIKVANQSGTAQPDPMNREMGFYNGKEVKVIDTVVNLSLLQNGAMVIPDCGRCGFHSVEYKITFGAMLRNTFTFGKRKSIKVKYVCTKTLNQ